MSATEITTQNVVGYTGVTPSYENIDASDGNCFDNDGSIMLHVKNNSGQSMNVVVDSLKNCDQGTNHDITVAIANGAEKFIGPFSQGRFNDGSGQVGVTYTGAGIGGSDPGATVAALKVWSTPLA
jgi:hypothetical protein